MKTFILSFLFSCITSILLAESAPQELPVQKRIENKLYACFTEQSVQPLTSLYPELEKQNTQLTPYWIAYTKFYEAIYYLKTQDTEQAQKCLAEAELLLEKIKDKTSEDYALLAYLESFSLQFKSGTEAGKISAKVTANAQKAVQMDSTNLRGWYVSGSHDFYMPAAYGGGQKAESYLLKAIRLPAQNLPHPWLPSWGKAEAYDMLIRLYLGKGNTTEARKYYESLKTAYPESYLISQYAEKFN